MIMQAIIVGAGKIGFIIAKLLVQEKYDVVVIEMDEERANNLQECLDIQVIIGSGTSPHLLKEAGVKGARLLVAVTECDEVNMVACMLAKQLGVEKTVARVRNFQYLEETRLLEETLPGIDFIINPELVTAIEIAKLIDVPEASDVGYYANGKVQVLEMKIAEDSPAANKYIKDLKSEYSFLIVGIFRGGKLLIPGGDDQLRPKDVIYLLAKTEEMYYIKRLLSTEKKKVQRVMILGGGFIAYHLAKILEKRKSSVKLIEKDYKKCQEMANKLDHTLVLNGDATDIELLKQEGTENCDIFVCLTGDDKLNLLVSLIVKHLGAKRTITQVRRSDYIGLMENVGIDAGVSPRILTANAVLKFINKGENLLSVTLLNQENAEMLEIKISPEARVCNKKIMDLNFPSGAIISSIYRDNQVYIANGDVILKPGDVITVFALAEVTAKVKEYLAVR